MNCQHCRHENPAGSNFCSNCGKRIGDFCPQCKQRVPVNATFCNHCGYEITPQNLSDVLAMLKRGESINLDASLENLETHLITTAMEFAGGNVTRAAELLQVHRTTLYSRIQAKTEKRRGHLQRSAASVGNH
jgi:DNA-binding NtrC family response regulator